jgi:hypothetical protein
LLAVEEAKQAAGQDGQPAVVPTAVIASAETGEQAAPLTGAQGETPQATDFAASQAKNENPEEGEHPDPGTVAL